MKKVFFFIFLLVLLLLIGCSAKSSLAGSKVTIFKGQSCGCCGVYTNYLSQKGFEVQVTNMADLSSLKAQYHIPASMESCHTTVIDNYVVEGHMPVEAIEKLMNERPTIRGIAMPGMPYGSPGMPGAKDGPFVIYALQNDGSITEFMRI